MPLKLALLWALCVSVVHSQRLLPAKTIGELAATLSGESAKRNLEFIARLHRTRGSDQFRAAAEHIAAQARAYGLADARVEEFPADGKRFYGTQKSRRPWQAEFAELWEMRDGVPVAQIANWEAMPLSLAQDSESGEVTAELIDVGQGTSEKDYAGKDVRGKLALVAAQPGAVAELAAGKLGAAGIISYAQNQRTAWWGDDDRLVRWGHLETFSPVKTFAFMVSLQQARAFRDRLARGETIRLRAKVVAGQRDGAYHIVTATLPGSDPQLRNEEIVFSCHLDHPRPGANDNASGCATILEIARTLARLPRPKRTLRFIWPPEIEGTVVYLNARPEVAARIKAAIHLDMVGGGPETKAVFHVTRSPASLPTYVNDVAEAIGRFVNEQSAQFAATGEAEFPLVAPEGGKEALLADFAEFTEGSDHQVYTEGSWRIPAIYLNDWPDRYIHTNYDLPAHIDPTKLKRAAFIAAASGYYLAGAEGALPVWPVVQAQMMRRAARMMERRTALPPDEAANLTRFFLAYERGVAASIPHATDFVDHLARLLGAAPAPPAAGVVYTRHPQIKGPMSVFGYDYFTDHYGRERGRNIRLLRIDGPYAYEALNFVDGRRTIQEIRDALSAAYGPVPLDAVEEYLRALESIGVIQKK